MRLTRRRFLAVTAAACAAPQSAAAASWRGVALGAEASLVIRGPREEAEAALAAALAEVAQTEALFSLYRPDSALVRLNEAGRLAQPPDTFRNLMVASDTVYRLTEGRFDPTIQALWQARAHGGDTDAACDAMGWPPLAHATGPIRLAPGQALTFNGIAQGFATDRVTAVLATHGFDDVLVNIGEYRGLGGPWRIGIADPVAGLLGQQTLRDAAIATSSPGALALAGGGHILHPDHAARWSTVSVTARNATLADGLSTALCLASRDMIGEIARHPEVLTIRVVDADGNLRSFT